ncbi:unnamed protein product [Adineta ricciae]|uniref:Uncharacterized protein n=1 Tax=Adineta ricciae TaxID=249248 RepID=A0A815VTM0_ADIRI|nr:unnamed protein product [Adineta ricciae]CAF1556564.1 unnamed protein product [Adineta ricciae]
MQFKGIDIDDDGSIYFADAGNDRVIRQRMNTTRSEIVAGGNGFGNRTNQLNSPTDVVVDKEKNSLIICDKKNRRVMRWSLQNLTEQRIIISNINCNGLAIDQDGSIYVSDNDQAVVKRWKDEEKIGEVVAGGNLVGDALDQLDQPSYVFVDHHYSVYVSDTNNNRVMKWTQSGKAGIVVAGGNAQGDNIGQLFLGNGVVVDHLGNVYVADSLNNRVVCWSEKTQESMIVVGGYGKGSDSHLFNGLDDIAFDRKGNLYVVDIGNRRIQKFDRED